MKKRNMMKKALGIAALLAMSAFAKEELNLYIWSAYIDPEVVTDFETEFDCTVNVSHYLSNEEMLAKLQAGGVSQYDIVVPGDYIVPSLVNLGYLQPIDHSKIPNMKNLKDNFIDPFFDKNNTYTVGWQWGTVGVIYNKDKFPGQVLDSWEPLLNPKPETRYVYFDSIREMIGAGERFLGSSINSMDKNELKAVAKLLVAGKKRPGFKGFEGHVGGRNKLIADQIDIGMVYSGDAVQITSEHENLAYYVPKEGTVIFLDSLCIPAKAPNPELAMKFMNYILRADVGAKVSNYSRYGSPNKASRSMINEADRNNPAVYPDVETEKRLEFIDDLGRGNSIYADLWKMIKTR